MIVTMRHEIAVGDGVDPVLVEEQDYVMREAAGEAAPAASAESVVPRITASHERVVTPDETLLFRYCAVTFNTHRIHYDRPYAERVEGYPALVVNGGLPVLLLVELFRSVAGREPCGVTSRNVAPLSCGRPMRLCAEPGDPEWRLWAEDDTGRPAVEVLVR